MWLRGENYGYILSVAVPMVVVMSVEKSMVAFVVVVVVHVAARRGCECSCASRSYHMSIVVRRKP